MIQVKTKFYQKLSIRPTSYLEIIKASDIVISPSSLISLNIISDLTTTLHLSIHLPSEVDAVIVTIPFFFPVTIPLLTVAILLSSLVHEIEVIPVVYKKISVKNNNNYFTVTVQVCVFPL